MLTIPWFKSAHLHCDNSGFVKQNEIDRLNLFWLGLGQQVCITGTRFTRNGTIVTSRTTQGTVCTEVNECMLSTVYYNDRGVRGKIG